MAASTRGVVEEWTQDSFALHGSPFKGAVKFSVSFDVTL
jgi:hypothetical protein